MINGLRQRSQVALCGIISVVVVLNWEIQITIQMSPFSTWSAEEDQFLMASVENTNYKRWKRVYQDFKVKFPLSNRTTKQLRARYKNFLQYNRQNQLNSQWSESQISTLFDGYEKQGPKWTLLSNLLPTKSQSALKNKFYGCLRKLVRKIAFARKKIYGNSAKKLKYESVIRILDVNRASCVLPAHLLEQATALKKQIISLAQHQLSVISEREIITFSEQLFQFNYDTRYYRVKKSCKRQGPTSEQAGLSKVQAGLSRSQDQGNSQSFAAINIKEQILPKLEENYEEAIQNQLKSKYPATVKLQKQGQIKLNNEVKYQPLPHPTHDYMPQYISSSLIQQQPSYDHYGQYPFIMFFLNTQQNLPF